MNDREQSGLLIAATCRITRKGDGWFVPSQSGNGSRYAVHIHPDNPSCTCADFELTGKPCKHIIAARHVARREQQEFEFDPPEAAVIPPEKKQRKTYPQQWRVQKQTIKRLTTRV